MKIKWKRKSDLILVDSLFDANPENPKEYLWIDEEVEMSDEQIKEIFKLFKEVL